MTIHVWIIMGIIRKTTDSSLDVFSAIQFQDSAMQSIRKLIYLKLNPLCKVCVYNADQLKYIKGRIDHDRKLRILDYKAWVNIRKFRISRKKPRRGRKADNVKYCESKTRTVNFDNLIPIARIQESKITRFTKQIKFVTLNAQSIKNKGQLIVDYLLNEHIDVAIITETWLKDADDIWLQGCELNKKGYKTSCSNRKNRQGGGVALVYKDSLTIKMLKMDQSVTFEKAMW